MQYITCQNAFGCCSVSQSCPTLWLHRLQHAGLPLSFTISRSLLKLMSIELMMPSSHLILCHLLLLLFSIFPTQGLFQSVGCYCSFSFSISPSDEYSGLISFRIDWFDLLCPRNSQEYFPLPQFESISSLVLSLLYSQLSHLYVTTGKTIALTIQTFVGKMMSLLFNTLSRFVIAIFLQTFQLMIKIYAVNLKNVWVDTVFQNTFGGYDGNKFGNPLVQGISFKRVPLRLDFFKISNDYLPLEAYVLPDCLLHLHICLNGKCVCSIMSSSLRPHGL